MVDLGFDCIVFIFDLYGERVCATRVRMGMATRLFQKASHLI